MEKQHRKITGYRELSQVEIDLMNEIKAEGERLQALCDKVAIHITDQFNTADEAERERLEDAAPDMWNGHAVVSFKVGLMALTRAVGQQTNF